MKLTPYENMKWQDQRVEDVVGRRNKRLRFVIWIDGG